MPTLFSFTDAPAKHKVEKDLERWEAAKRRRLSKDLMAISIEEGEVDEVNDGKED